MTPNDDTKFQILNDHYKDSFIQLKDSIKLRDKLFLLILITVTIILFQMYSPKESGLAISQFITKQLELKKSIDISFIGSIIWLGLLVLVIRYFQTTIYIERQYEYIHLLEKQISPIYNDIVFVREGEHYLSNYPILLGWVWILYTIIFPILLMVVIVEKLVTEYSEISNLFIFNAIIFLFITISTILYMINMHKKSFIKLKKEIGEIYVKFRN